MNPFFKRMQFANIILRGIGQIMLQENRWTGLFFLAGIFIGSWQYGVAAIIATVAGTVSAILLKYDIDEINSGLYGFSAALVGIALIFYFRDTFLIWILIILGSVFACMLQHFFIRIKISGYTFPFVFISWILIYFIHRFTTISPSVLPQNEIQSSSFDYLLRIARGFGQVIFQRETISGIIFFIGVFISSRVAALYGLTASFLSAYLSQIAGQSLHDIDAGLYGFNAVLTAIVFAGFKKTDEFWLFVALIFTIVINLLLVNSQILNAFGGVLTFPFVAGTWLTFLLKKLVKQFLRKNQIPNSKQTNKLIN